jgi:dihydrofolate synthase/folylpolyglutamate synthase
MNQAADTFSAPAYQDALRRLLGLADYERMAGLVMPAQKYDLGRMFELAGRMGNPQRAVPIVHVAGTKGKGSTAAMISSILAVSGRRVGMFTSPHLHTFRERLCINGEPLSEVRFVTSLDRIWPHVEAMASDGPASTPTTFEVLTAMAFDLPLSEAVDILVLEVGMGGRLDSTNVAEATVDVITSISLDHTAILGDTIEKIAAEKAGIVKSPVPVIIAPQVAAVLQVIHDRANLIGSLVTQVGTDVQLADRDHSLDAQRFTITTAWARYDLELPLLGAYQQENAACAVAAAEVLGVTAAAIHQGIREVHWDGRFQVVSKAGPIIVVDGAHNPQSMSVLRETVHRYIVADRITVVFGCSGDKELNGMVDELRHLATEVIVCASRHPRSVAIEPLLLAFEKAGVLTCSANDVGSALDMARASSGQNDAVVVTGSLFVVAEALEAWNEIEPERYPELDPKEPIAAPATGLSHLPDRTK